MKQVKLLLIAPAFYPTHGGAELRFFRYLPLLNEYGVNVQVICGTPKYKKFTVEDIQAAWRGYADGTLISNVNIENADIYKFKLPEKNSTARMQIILEKVVEHCQSEIHRPDVIQILSPISAKLIGYLENLKAMGISIVLSYSIAHDFSKNVFIKKYQKSQVRKVFKQYDRIIVASSVLRDLIVDVFPKARTTIIPNGVDTTKFSPIQNKDAKLALRKKLGLPSNAKLITLVGAIHPRKGTQILIEAWTKLIKSNPNLHIVLLGPRYDQTRGELKIFSNQIESYIDSSNMRQNVHFIGQVVNVSEYLQASDLFVFPSEREGMPNAVLEAMASGLPTIVTPFIGLSKDLGNENQEYLLVDRSASAIAAAIQKVISDDDLQASLASNARRWLEDTMDIKHSVQAYADLYHSLSIQTNVSAKA